MNQATPAVQELARQILTQEAHTSDPSMPPNHAALRAIEKLRLSLCKLLGVAGFQAILARALALTKKEVRGLEGVQVNADRSFEGADKFAGVAELDRVGETSSQQNGEEATGWATFLEQTLGLLVLFIGETLTLRLVRGIWPNLSLDDNPPLKSTQETP